MHSRWPINICQMNEIPEYPLWARPCYGAEDIEVQETAPDFTTLNAGTDSKHILRTMKLQASRELGGCYPKEVGDRGKQLLRWSPITSAPAIHVLVKFPAVEYKPDLVTGF